MLSTSNFTRRLTFVNIFIALALCSAPYLFAQTNPATNEALSTQTTGTNSSTLIRWRARPSVNRYRLQLALDNSFDDIVLDRAVFANTYQVTELPPGKYYWRVAPATTETERYTTVGVVIIAQADMLAAQLQPTPQSQPTPSNPAVASVRSEPVSLPPLSTGWNTAIGEALSIAVGRFSPTAPPSVIALNSNGTIYALDARRGVAQWTTRFDPARRFGETVDRSQIGEFVPLVSQSGVVVAFKEGVRLIEGISGREVWRASVSGQPVFGLVFDTNGDGTAEVIVATKSPDKLIFINNRTGRIEREQSLDGAAVGAPLPLQGADGTEVLIALDNGRLAIFNSRATDSSRSIKLDTRITTAPILVGIAAGARLLVGTERGLVALQLPDMQPVWRIATEGEPPRGSLASADLDGDGNVEAVMITRNGRVAVVDVERGVIRWIVEGATDTAGAVFADVNGDGAQDVIVAGKKEFAVGYSGRDGKLVWSTEEAGTATAAAVQNGSSLTTQTSTLRSLLVTPLRDENGVVDGALLIGADLQRISLRAVRLSRNALAEAAR